MSRIIKASVAGGAHPDVSTHDAMGLSTDAELTTHAGTPHGHPDLSTHDTLGLSTDAELTTHAGVSAAATHGSLGHSNASDHVNSEAAHGWHVAHIDSLTASEHTAIGDGTPHHAAAHGDHGVASHASDVTDPHSAAAYVKEGDANWIDLTDAGATTLHSHAGGGHPDLPTHDALGLATDTELTTHAALPTHHTRAHDPVVAADHAVTGLTPGHVLTVLAGGASLTWAAPAGGAAADPTYSPGSFTVVTETQRLAPHRLQMTAAQRITIEGTGRLSLYN